MSIQKTFEEQYDDFFNFFNNNHSIEEIEEFITKNDIPSFSPYKQIHLNMIDSRNLNILFYIILKSTSDEDCLEKLKLLIEKYNVNYKVFDFNCQRRIPFYTCIKGYLESTKYIIEKLNYKIELMDNREQTLFFSAFKSYNLELVKYLDKKFPKYIFFPDNQYNSCIYDIFKKNMNSPEQTKKFENVLKYIINRGFDIFEKNNDNISFVNKCEHFKKLDTLEKIIKEIGGEYARKYFKIKYMVNKSNGMDFDDNNGKENKDIKNNINDNNSKININIKNNNNEKINDIKNNMINIKNTNKDLKTDDIKYNMLNIKNSYKDIKVNESKNKFNNEDEKINDIKINTINFKNNYKDINNYDIKNNMNIKNNNNGAKIIDTQINIMNIKNNKRDVKMNDKKSLYSNNDTNNKNIINRNNIDNLINDMSHYIDNHYAFLENKKTEKKEKNEKIVIKDYKELNESKNKKNNLDSNLRKNDIMKNKSKDIKNSDFKKQNPNFDKQEQKNIFEGVKMNWSIKISNNNINSNKKFSNQSDNNIIKNDDFSNVNISNNNISIEKLRDNLSKKEEIETNLINNKNNNNLLKQKNELPVINFNELINHDKNKNEKKYKPCIFLNRKTNFLRDIEKIKKIIKNAQSLKKFSSRVKKQS